MSERLVGRAAQLSAIEATIAEVAAGGCRIMRVSGDPGMGKTRMLGLLGERATENGMCVRYASAASAGPERPFGAISAALGEIDPTVPDPEVPVFPAATSEPLRPPGARAQIYRTLRLVLEDLARTAGLVLCLDDLHWADPETVEFLAHLVKRPPRGPLLLVLAYRPRQLRLRLAETLALAGPAQLTLGPLSERESAEMAGLRPGHPRAAALHAAGEGNPLYLKLLAREETGATEPMDPFAAELGRLPELDRLVLISAAVADEVFDADLVAAIAGRARPEVVAALDRLAEADLVRASSQPAGLRHRHPVVRRAVYRSADAGWLPDAHRRALHELTGRGASAQERARHADLSARPGDEDAIAVLVEAAEASENSAPQKCARWLAAALRLMPGNASSNRDRDRRLTLTAMRARALATSGRLGEAREVVREALGLVPAGQPERRAPLTALSAMLERALGAPARARAMVLAELDRLPGRSRPPALLLELAVGELLGAPVDGGESWAEKALAAIGRDAGAPCVHSGHRVGACHACQGGHGADIATALALRGCVDLRAGRMDFSGPEAVAEAVRLTDGLTDAQLTVKLDAALWLGWWEVFLDRCTDAARHLRRALDLAVTTGQDHLAGYLRAGLGTAYAALGRLTEAAGCLADAADGARATGNDELALIAFCQASWVESWRGNPVAARELAGRARDFAPAPGGFFAPVAAAMAALAAYCSGDYDACVAQLVDGASGPDLTLLEAGSRAGWYQLLTEAEATRGRTGEAKAWARRARAAAETLPLPGKQAFAMLAEAWAAGAEPAVAAALAERAAEGFAGIGDRVNQGRAMLLAGRCGAEAGQPERAKRLLANAENVFTDCGADAFAGQASRARRRPGPRRDDGGPLAALTQRERAVALMVAEGRTNREVAELLGLSARTVETHLSRVYTKLGVTSRSALGVISGGLRFSPMFDVVPPGTLTAGPKGNRWEKTR